MGRTARCGALPVTAARLGAALVLVGVVLLGLAAFGIGNDDLLDVAAVGAMVVGAVLLAVATDVADGPSAGAPPSRRVGRDRDRDQSAES